jgi:hypothetical protein
LREIPELRKNLIELDQGCQPAARKFSYGLLLIGKFRPFFSGYFQNFSTVPARGVQPAAQTKLEQKFWESSGVSGILELMNEENSHGFFLNFLGFCWKFQKEFQSLQGGQIIKVFSKSRCFTDLTNLCDLNRIKLHSKICSRKTLPTTKNQEKKVSSFHSNFLFLWHADCLIFLIIFSDLFADLVDCLVCFPFE